MSQEKYFSPFPTHLRELLVENKTSITALARELGITRQAVSQYADGTSQPNVDKLNAIAEHFHVTTDWLLGRSGGVKSVDPDIRSATEYTGLSEQAVENLHLLDKPLKRMFSYLLTTDRFLRILILFSSYEATCNFVKLHEDAAEKEKVSLEYELDLLDLGLQNGEISEEEYAKSFMQAFSNTTEFREEVSRKDLILFNIQKELFAVADEIEKGQRGVKHG